MGAVSEVVSASGSLQRSISSISSISLSTGCSRHLENISLLSLHLLLSLSASVGATACSASSMAWTLSPLSLMARARPPTLLPVPKCRKEKLLCDRAPPSVAHMAVRPWSPLWPSCCCLEGLTFVFLLSMKLNRAVSRSIVPAFRKLHGAEGINKTEDCQPATYRISADWNIL